VVLTIALIVIWGLVHLVGGGGTPKAGPAADLTAGSQSPSPTPTGSPSEDPSITPLVGPTTTPSVDTTPSTSPSPTVLPSPTGACPPSDVSVTPSVGTAAAGSDVTIALALQTFSTPACTWQVSHKTMQVKITTAGGSDVWSTIQCHDALPSSTVILYRDQPTPVTLTWSSKLADATCSTHTDWAKIGSYRVTGVALGGQPDEASFTLGAAAAPPKPSTTPSGTASAPVSPSSTPTSKPTLATTAGAAGTPKSTAKPSTSPVTKKAKKKHPVAD